MLAKLDIPLQIPVGSLPAFKKFGSQKSAMKDAAHISEVLDWVGVEPRGDFSTETSPTNLNCGFIRCFCDELLPFSLSQS